jgi:hypothetical protein
MRKPFDIFGQRYDLLQILVLPRAEDGVVDYYAVDFGVVVRVDEGVFEELAIDFAELECEATMIVSTRNVCSMLQE